MGNAHDGAMHSQPSARVLVVDDEVELMTVLCEMLNEHAYEAAGCVSAEAALGILQEREMDLLITDLMMPGMDGITLLRRAQELQPYLLGIVATGQGTIRTAVDAMKSGAFDYVLKPFRLSALLPTLARAVEVGRLKRDNVQLRETVAIYELSQAVALSLDRPAILRSTVQAALTLCEADAVSIMEPSASGDALQVTAVGGSYPAEMVGRQVPAGRELLAWAARSQERSGPDGVLAPLPFSEPDGSALPDGTIPADIRPESVTDVTAAPLSVVSVPMLAAGRLVGVLNVGVRRRTPPGTPGQLKALTLLTNTAAAAVEHAALYEQQQAEERERLLALERAARAEAEHERAARVVAEQAVAMRDEFLSVAAHELKTPITSLLGAVQLLIRQQARGLTLAPGQIRRSMQIVDRQAVKLSRLVTHLLETSRVDARRFIAHRTTVDLTTLVGAMVDQVQGTTERHQIVLSAPPRVVAQVDPPRIEQVVSNLLDNAVKFSPEGGRIEVQLSTVDTREVRMVVRDYGIGIPAARRDALFTRYYQAHAESHRSGLGLGLYVSRCIVELHGGRISVEFPGDAGSCFVVHLPIVAPDGPTVVGVNGAGPVGVWPARSESA